MCHRLLKEKSRCLWDDLANFFTLDLSTKLSVLQQVDKYLPIQGHIAEYVPSLYWCKDFEDDIKCLLLIRLHFKHFYIHIMCQYL